MNVLERFAIMVPDDEISTAHLGLLVETREIELLPGMSAGRSLETAREQFERRYIHKALGRNGWDIARTAAELRIGETDLEALIKAHGITFID